MPSLTQDTTTLTDDLNLLNTEEDVEVSDAVASGLEQEEVPEEAEEEVEESSEESSEVEEETEQPKVDLPFNRPTIKEIKAKYPEFFKDFPDLKDAFFREQQYTTLFPTVEDAKEAFDDNEAFATLSDASLAGDSGPILESLKKTDPKAYETFSLSFLPNLYKESPEVYQTIISPLFENFFRAAYKSGDENMKNSAINLAAYFFDDANAAEKSVKNEKTISKSIQVTEEQNKLKETQNNNFATAFRAASSDVQVRLDRSLDNLIGKDFDPNKSFTDFTKSAAIKEVRDRINKQLASDKGHMQLMANRWKKARSNGYSEPEKVKIISTFLSRAKVLIPSIREEVRSAALGKSIRQSEDKLKRIGETHKEVVSAGRVSKSESAATNHTKKDFRKMTDAEILAL